MRKTSEKNVSVRLTNHVTRWSDQTALNEQKGSTTSEFRVSTKEYESIDTLRSQLEAFEELEESRKSEYGAGRKSVDAVRHMDKMRDLKKRAQMAETQKLESERKAHEFLLSLTAEEAQEMKRATAWKLLFAKNESMTNHKEPEDWRDWSRNPSYTRFELPYHLICRIRYEAKKKLYEEQFQAEIKQLLEQQSEAYEAARLVRHLAYTTLWPPLHSSREIVQSLRYRFNLPQKDFKHIREIMERIPEENFS